MTDQQDRDAPGLGKLDQGGGHLADLGDVAGRALDVTTGDGLDGVDDDQIGPNLVDVTQHRGQVGLSCQEEVSGHRFDALGPHPDLRSRFFATDIQDGLFLPGGSGGDIQ